ncbi:MAG: hypothetical protein ACI35V_10445 [Sphingobacterium composti]|uniref:hypothetical protein n=1 Tax=Sphingobacterium composti TaxID=363260 RepID=UPI0013586689|nr:hypothetical protein [Sphingobacterium composti Ten et al. 2007 non Yoo et al. 2007]
MNRLLNYILLSVVAIILISCTKEVNSFANIATLNVKVLDVEYNTIPNTLATSSFNFQTTKDNREFQIPWEDDLILSVNIKANQKNIEKIGTTINPKPNKKERLSEGVQVRLLIFDSSNKFILSRDFLSGHAGATDIKLPLGQHYSFITYSYGETQQLSALNLAVGTSLENVVIQLNGIKDLMYSTKLNVKLSGGTNNLEFVLKHVFTKIATTINSTDAGSIAHVGKFKISNVYNSVNFKFNQTADNSLERIFRSSLVTVDLIGFQPPYNRNIVSSPEQLIYTNGTDVQTLSVDVLKINNVEKTNLTLIHFNFQPGIYYDIEIKVKKGKPEDEEFIIGNLIWGRGNLIALKQNDGYKYTHADNQGEYGDYWYKNASKTGYYKVPMKDQPGHNDVDVLLGETVTDICSQIGDGWRVPTPAEIKSLRDYAVFDMKWNNTHKYKDGKYTTPNGSKINGMYFGTKDQPSVSDQDKYLFLPYAGMYNSGRDQGLTSIGSYWHTGRDNKLGYTYQFESGYFKENESGSSHAKRSNPIRCVKSKI